MNKGLIIFLVVCVAALFSLKNVGFAQYGKPYAGWLVTQNKDTIKGFFRPQQSDITRYVEFLANNPFAYFTQYRPEQVRAFYFATPKGPRKYVSASVYLADSVTNLFLRVLAHGPHISLLKLDSDRQYPRYFVDKYGPKPITTIDNTLQKLIDWLSADCPAVGRRNYVLSDNDLTTMLIIYQQCMDQNASMKLYFEQPDKNTINFVFGGGVGTVSYALNTQNLINIANDGATVGAHLRFVTGIRALPKDFCLLAEPGFGFYSVGYQLPRPDDVADVNIINFDLPLLIKARFKPPTERLLSYFKLGGYWAKPVLSYARFSTRRFFSGQTTVSTQNLDYAFAGNELGGVAAVGLEYFADNNFALGLELQGRLGNKYFAGTDKVGRVVYWGLSLVGTW